MAKTKISEFSATPANNTDIDSINIAEGCAPSGINDAIRELMAQLKDFQTGAVGDSFNGPVGTSTAAAGAFTTLSSTGNTTLGDASGDAVTINGTATFANANPTFSGGTANGVTYLNGSKVLTSGSALQFNGSQFGVNTTPSQAIDVVTDGASSIIRSTAYRASDGQAGINLRFARGSVASPTIVLTGDTIGTMEFYPYNGTNFNLQTALISAKVTGTVTTSNIPTALVFGLDAAGAAYSNEQMRLTSTGLGIKTSTPITPLTVQANSGGDATSLIGRSTGQNEAWLLWYKNGGSVTNAGILGDNQGLKFGIGSGLTEAARFDTSGNLNLGTTGSSNRLEVASSTNSTIGITRIGSHNVTLNAIAGGAFTIGQDGSGGGTERLRIDSSGNLLVGTSSNNGRLCVQGATANSSANALYVTSSSGSQMFLVRNDGALRSESTYYITTASAGNLNIDTSGYIARSTSSLKYKNNVQDATHGLSKVLALRPVTYKGNNNGDTVFGGLIAEEVHEAGLTEFVQYAEDGSPDALAYGNMVSLAFKAIQEQQAIIESLKARLDAANL